MQILILSDSHAMDASTLLSLLKHHDTTYYIHCGDIYMTYEGLPLSNFYIVRGNNDFYDIPFDITTTIDNLRFFITHGHRYHINSDIDTLIYRAKEVHADIVCFGHTHRPYVETIEGVLCINPGSVSYPRGSYREPTYCIFDTTTRKIVFYNAKTMTPCDPFAKSKKDSFTFKNIFKK